MKAESTDKRMWTRVSEDGKSAAAGMSLGSGGGTGGGIDYTLGCGGNANEAFSRDTGKYVKVAGSGTSNGPVYRGKVTLPNEVRRPVTQPAQTGKAAPPPPPAPRQPHMTWDQRKGVLRDEQGRVMTDKGYSGQGDAKNNSSQEHVEDHGPIPQGNWRMEEVRDEQFHKRLARPIYRLVPDDETRARVEAMGRKPDSFLIHGDNDAHTASTGCIVVDRITRQQLKSHARGWIHVRK